MIITLVGYRGTGKTTVACGLAHRLGWSCVDADEVLIARDGRSIAEIFATEGEAAFRDLEAKLLRELVDRMDVVLATGGGVVVRPENRKLLSTLNPVIWLEASAETILARLTADEKTQANRPSLTTLPAAEEIRTLLAERDPWYREVATLIVQTDGKSSDDITHEILNALHLEGSPA